MPDTTQPQPVDDTATKAGVQPADLAEFDLDEFLAGVIAPTRTVAVTQDRTLGEQARAQLALINELEDAERTTKAAGGKSTRRAGATESPELTQARARLDELNEAAKGTFVWVRVTAMDRAVKAQAIKDGASGGAFDRSAYNLSVIAHTATVHKHDPRTHPDAPGAVLTLEQWERLSLAIGSKQWDAIVDAANVVNEEGVAPDFSQPPSHSPDGGTSSES